MKRLILATASVIALGIAGAGPIYAAGSTATTPTPMAPAIGTGTAATGTTQSSMPQTGGAMQPAMPPMGSSANLNKPYMAGTTPQASAAANAPRSEIRQAQQKLRQDHLYRGRIDGMVGPQTRQALQQYQRKNGLPVTAQLDQSTMSSLLGGGGGQGSSMPPASSGMMPPNGAGTSGNGLPNSSSPNSGAPNSGTPNSGTPNTGMPNNGK